MEEALVKKILQDTENGYDLIAEKFSQTRNRFWGELEFIKKFAPPEGRVLDFGCGNGRLLEILIDKKINYVGVDVSQNLINLGKKNLAGIRESRRIQFLKIENDFKKLPFPSEFFDTIYSIAVFHHLPGAKQHKEIISELYRLLKPGGYLVVTVWDLWQPKYRKNIFKNWKDKLLGRSALEFNDCFISFTDNQGQKFNRFHHAFTKGGIKKLLSQGGFGVRACRRIKGNIVVIGKK